MAADTRLKWFLIASPLLVLILTKAGVLLSTAYVQPEVSWIPAVIGYYLSIGLMFFMATRYFSFSIKEVFTMSFRPVPKFRLMFFGLILPALLPLPIFMLNIKDVPIQFIVYILVFSVINPVFEEGFWRGLLNALPGSNSFRIIYSSVLFSFSHYFFWAYWFKVPEIIIPTVISTFIMGVLWMWFMQKQKNLLYPILSHAAVDTFNLSVAVYVGLYDGRHIVLPE